MYYTFLDKVSKTHHLIFTMHFLEFITKILPVSLMYTAVVRIELNGSGWVHITSI